MPVKYYLCITQIWPHKIIFLQTTLNLKQIFFPHIFALFKLILIPLYDSVYTQMIFKIVEDGGAAIKDHFHSFVSSLFENIIVFYDH